MWRCSLGRRNFGAGEHRRHCSIPWRRLLLELVASRRLYLVSIIICRRVLYGAVLCPYVRLDWRKLDNAFHFHADAGDYAVLDLSIRWRTPSCTVVRRMDFHIELAVSLVSVYSLSYYFGSVLQGLLMSKPPPSELSFIFRFFPIRLRIKKKKKKRCATGGRPVFLSLCSVICSNSEGIRCYRYTIFHRLLDLTSAVLGPHLKLSSRTDFDTVTFTVAHLTGRERMWAAGEPLPWPEPFEPSLAVSSSKKRPCANSAPRAPQPRQEEMVAGAVEGVGGGRATGGNRTGWAQRRRVCGS